MVSLFAKRGPFSKLTGRLGRSRFGAVTPTSTAPVSDPPVDGGSGPAVGDGELREDGTFELREDGTYELRE